MPPEQVDPEAVTLDGEALDAPLGLFVALHKPVGYVCSHEDRDGRRVFELLARTVAANATPGRPRSGRLDKDSSGLLLVTDDCCRWCTR